MINSIFKKMLLLSLSISVGSLFCLSLLIGFLLEKQIYDRTRTTLESEAMNLNDDVIKFLDGEMEIEQLKETILKLKKQENIQVSIVTEQRKSLFANGDSKVQKWIDDVLEKKSGIEELTFHRNEQSKMFIVGIPILLHHENKGAIFLYTPMQEAEGLVHEINNIILLSVLLLIIPIVIVSFILAKRMVAPIVTMSETVKHISEGHFEEQIVLKGRDELVTLGDSINHMANKLAKIEQSRRRFIGEISHELRTPLTTIRTTMQGITDQIFSEVEEIEFLNLSIQEIKRISKLLDDLIDLSALEEKAVVLHKDSILITELLENSILQLSLQAKDKEIVFIKDMEKDVYALVDIDRMKQVFINLLDNAIKYSYRGSHIEIKVIKIGHKIRITIINRGNIIPSNQLPYLFDRFYKTDKSRNEKGNGLGLTICKQIVDLHKGSISVIPLEDKVCFIVELFAK
ncbi:ATP-binding protein [Bacillus sp. CGMCC 1.16607]|uniref:ATP-binding protein n=1 Tax=Bacillus sp. CGMCC 1.16607 TaxID=3351842 RepID=UPI00362C8B78